MNLASMLLASAIRAPDHPAVTEGQGTLSYGALAARAGALARALVNEGVQPGDRVAVLLKGGADAIAAIGAVHAAGAVALVINERLRPRQIEQLLARVTARALLTSAEALAPMPRPIETGAARIYAPSVADGPALDPVTRAPDDLAQIIFTSGSTGLPKGVVFTHAAIGHGVRIVAGYLGLAPVDRVAAMLPFSSVYGLNQALTALSAGATLIVVRSMMMNDAAGVLRAQRATVLAAVPPLWSQLMEAPRFTGDPLPDLRILQNAGGHLPPDLVRRIRSLLPQARLFLQYGQTETFRGTFLPPEEVDRHPDSMGRAMPETIIRVVRDDGSICDEGETGELVHEGPTIAEGYWDDATATDAVFRPNTFGGPHPRVVWSGDMVRRGPDGLLTFKGRRDRMIKTMGFRVGPDEIGDVLHASGDVDDAVVAGAPDPARGEIVVAWVVLSPGGSADHLMKFCRAELPPYMVPARIEVRPSLPRLPGGKHDVQALVSER